MSMGSRLRTLVTVALGIFIVAAVATAPEPDVDRALRIGRQIRCPVCSGESIADSPATLAESMMTLVRERIDDGLSDEQVIEAVLAGYGSDAQRLDPRFGARTAVLWVLPAAVVVVGVVVGLGRRRDAEATEQEAASR